MLNAERVSAVETTDALPEPSEDYIGLSATSPGRMAWLVMLLAFAMFCLLTVTAGLVIYAFLFSSTIALEVELRVAQGTVGITGSDYVETVERESENLTNTSASISTDSLSQATIQFHHDQSSEDELPQLLAAVTLQSNTYVSFERAARPRFDWNPNHMTIHFADLKGKLDVLVTGADGKPFALTVDTEKGVSIKFVSNGRYRVTATDDDVRVLNLSGQASVSFSDDKSGQWSVPQGQELVVRLGNRVIEARATMQNLLPNASFSLHDANISFAEPGESISQPHTWVCETSQDSDPLGSASLGDFDGRNGLQLRRLQNATSHGKVFCERTFGEEGLDVSAYDSIEVIVSFYVSSQSLSQCGIDGSECPLMLHLKHEDYLGVPRSWRRGFHYEKEVSTDYPTLCDTCKQDHQIINKRAWYTFESENLLSVIDELKHPERLFSIILQASGHQFDTIISEVLLLVDSSDANGASDIATG